MDASVAIPACSSTWNGGKPLSKPSMMMSRKNEVLMQQAEYDEQVRSYARLLRECSSSKNKENKETMLWAGKHIHEEIEAAGLSGNAFLGNHVVEMYLKCGSLEDARGMFDRMQQRDVVLWTSMIAAYAQNGHCRNALGLFLEMQLDGVVPDGVTFSTMVNACAADPALLPQGRLIHARIAACGLDSHVVVATALVKMYARSGSIGEALGVFQGMTPQRDVIAWTGIITAFAENGHSAEALQLFQRMQLEGMRPDEITFVTLLNSCCTSAEHLAQGRLLHARIAESCCTLGSDIVIDTALLNMYGSCGSLADARGVFDKMQQHNVVSWTSMISLSAHHGQLKESLKLFRKMQLDGTRPNTVTLATIVSVCATMPEALAEGRLHHANIVQAGLDSDPVVQNALLNMYAKCGSLDDARNMFDLIQQHHRSMISWNAMLAAYAQHGRFEAVLGVFQELLLTGLEPDTITFVAILSACNHAGLLEEGCACFASIPEPKPEHYGCIIDLLGRAGYLKQAEELIGKMPGQADDVVWMSLLGACRTYGDLGLGERAAEMVIELNPGYVGAYVVLSNMYAAEGRWAEADNIRKLISASASAITSDSVALSIKCGLHKETNKY